MSNRVGDLNGKWSILFKLTLAVHTLLVPSIIAWGTWVTVMLFEINYQVRMTNQDKFTGTMFIQVQQELKEKNPDVNWLAPREVRSIQASDPHYK